MNKKYNQGKNQNYPSQNYNNYNQDNLTNQQNYSNQNGFLSSPLTNFFDEKII